MLYVSTRGRDANDGKTRETAFATLTRARDAMRETGEKSVTVLAGEYAMDRGLALDARDEGTTWTGEGECVFLGGRRVTGFHEATDADALSRLPEAAKAHVLEADLFAQGVKDFGVFRDRGGGRAATAHMELFYKGRRQKLACWPNEGYTRNAGLLPEHSFSYIENEVERTGSWTHFRFAEDKPLRWKRPEEVVLHGYWKWDYADRYIKPVRWDMANKVVEVEDQHGGYDIFANTRFRYVNVLEELDSPGEWYADRQTGKLYFWPEGTFEPNEAYVSVLEAPFLSLENAKNVTLEGIDFTLSRATAVLMKDCDGVTIRDCQFYNIGSNGVIAENVRNTVVDTCSFRNMGDGGVTVTGGDRKTLTPSNDKIVNCDIHHFGEWSRCYCHGVKIIGVGITVSHCSIHDAPQEALCHQGNDHLIEYNDFYHLCLEADDSGATHTGRDWTWRGNVLRYNRVHNIQQRAGSVSVVGIYLDDFTSGHVVQGNLFEQVTLGLMIGGGRHNQVLNNVFVNCKMGIELDARGTGWCKKCFDGRYTVMFDTFEAMRPKELPYSQRYPELMSYPDDEPAMPKYNALLDNRYWGCGLDLRLLDGLTEDITIHARNEHRDAPPEGWQNDVSAIPALTAGSTLDKR